MQLAGDLLRDADQDDLVASAYNRLLQTSHEGGLQLEEYRAIYMADRVRNASEVWMGATLGCALDGRGRRCTDPISGTCKA